MEHTVIFRIINLKLICNCITDISTDREHGYQAKVLLKINVRHKIGKIRA